MYGGLNLGYDEILEMPTKDRKWYVSRLEQQLAFEKEEMNK